MLMIVFEYTRCIVSQQLHATDVDLSTVDVGFIGLGGMGGLHASNVEDAGATIAAGADVVQRTREGFEREFDTDT